MKDAGSELFETIPGGEDVSAKKFRSTHPPVPLLLQFQYLDDPVRTGDANGLPVNVNRSRSPGHDGVAQPGSVNLDQPPPMRRPGGRMRREPPHKIVNLTDGKAGEARAPS
jgi:hypothetical protein